MSEQTFAVTDPATGEKVGSYPLMDEKEVDEAVTKAKEAQLRWAESSFEKRRKILENAAGILADNAEHYAGVVANETGKTVMDALIADVSTVCDVLRYYAKNAEEFLKPVKTKGSELLPGRKTYYIFEPRGVVGVISPWNYPFTLSAGPTITAIASGNTVVLKPSSQTTASGLILKEILEKAGLPSDVLQVVTGNGSRTGQALMENPRLDMLFFTGSTKVGREVNIRAARRLIPAIMELGGKDVAVVTAKADLDRAVYNVVWGAFTNCGQTCIGIEICLVHSSVYDEFLEKALRVTRNMKSGRAEGEVGSMTTRAQLQIVQEQVAEAEAGGAKILTGGKLDPDAPGMYFPPTILTDVSRQMKVMTEETFGPLLPIVPYEDIDEAIRLANSTAYGLSGAVFTKDMEEARYIAGRIKAGSININDALVTFAIPSLPFGGARESGVGRYHGDVGIRAFCEIKSITEFPGAWKKEFFHYPMTAGVQPALADTLRMVYSKGPWKRIRAGFKAVPFLIRAVRQARRPS